MRCVVMNAPLTFRLSFAPSVCRFAGNADKDYKAVFEGRNGYGSMDLYNSLSVGSPKKQLRFEIPDVYLLSLIKKLVKPEEPIVELGCNAGNNLLTLAGRGYRMFGVDLAQIRLAMLKDIASQEGLLPQVKVAQWDFVEEGSLPWPEMEGNFKAMYAVHVLPHLGSQVLTHTIQRLRRYLAKGAPFIATLIRREKVDNIRNQAPYWKENRQSVIQGGVAHSQDVIDQAFMGMRLNTTLSRPFLPDEPVYPGLEGVKNAMEWLVYENTGEPPAAADSQEPDRDELRRKNR